MNYGDSTGLANPVVSFFLWNLIDSPAKNVELCESV
jgi:hypothetical protein